jgi:hypothetical protein
MFLKIYANDRKFDLSLEKPPGEQPPAESDLRLGESPVADAAAVGGA